MKLHGWLRGFRLVDTSTPATSHPLAMRLLWLAMIWLLSVAVLGAVAYLLRLVLIR